MTVDDYLALITSEYQGLPNFTAVVSLLVAIPVQVQSLLQAMQTTLFDLSTPPVGDQLDILGAWAGVSRNVSIPITGIYFTWDDTSNPSTDGWDFGSWQPNNAPTTLAVLPDDAYLTLILAKIAANNWDGTTEGAYAIWDSLFSQFKILIFDNNNMSYYMGIVGGIVDSITLALLTGGYIPLRPEGVQIVGYYVAVDTNPGFGWDVENQYLQGWDQGSWLKFVS